MRVLYVSTEVHPILKTGGLADVNAALPRELCEAGADVRLLLPGFPALLEALNGARRVAGLAPRLGANAISLLYGSLAGMPAYLIDAPALYARPGNPYIAADGTDWPDNLERFALLGLTAAGFADGGIDAFRPDIVHGHDWHAGLSCAYLAARGGDRPGAVFTVHNLAYQGSFPGADFAKLGLPAHQFAMHGLEFHGALNCMKAGLFYADRITTVSPTYAREVQMPEHGLGMDGLLRSRAGALRGILNGVDTLHWNPATDPYLPAHFGGYDLAGKRACRAHLADALALVPGAGPLVAVVSRLTPQKGLDILVDALPPLVAKGFTFALLGSGDARLEAAWRKAAALYPGRVAVRIGYDEALAHRIIAGADMIAVPSRFEPCGLTQMYGLAYGTIPLVHRVGGLADTVVDATPAEVRAGNATGFVFDKPHTDDLLAAFGRALTAWNDPHLFRGLQRTGMAQNHAWTIPAEEYLSVYKELRPQA
ncbi:MAG: glycogen synthase GlgA [Burkholderiales bacterium]